MAIDRGRELALGLRPGTQLHHFIAAAAVAGSGAVTSEGTRAPSASPVTSRNVVRGSSSGAHWVPQRQHASPWLAIGAAQ
jgi:hypothetical protein